jgi:parallel beta-helix repeat protein
MRRITTTWTRGVTPYYYVDQTAGNDANAGTSDTAPWKTLAKVSGFTFPAMSNILLKRGETWAEQLTLPRSNLYLGNYGSGALPIITGSNIRDHCIDSVGKNNIIIDGISASNTVWETINIVTCINAVVKNCTSALGGNAAIMMEAVTGFDVFNNTITGSNGNGISVVGCTGGEVRNNDVAACGIVTDDRSCISLYTGNSNIFVHNNLCHDSSNAGAVGTRGIIVDTNNDAGTNYVYANRCYNCDGSGILVESSNNQQIYYNVCYGNGSTPNWNDGIKFLNSTGGLCYNNTCYGNRNSSIRCRNSVGVTIKNNIGWQTGNVCLVAEGTTPTTHIVDYNNWYGVANEYDWGGTTYANAAAFFAATGQGGHDFNTDPVCVATYNFHLQVTSPCRAAGVGVGLTADYDGATVPATPDIGAYQYI